VENKKAQYIALNYDNILYIVLLTCSKLP